MQEPVPGILKTSPLKTTPNKPIKEENKGDLEIDDSFETLTSTRIKKP
jgi:hypothetical protein